MNLFIYSYIFVLSLLMNRSHLNTSALVSLQPPKVVRARDRKFHKRFKNLPESEKVLKGINIDS